VTNEELVIEEEKTEKSARFVLNGRVNSHSADVLQFKLDKALNDGQVDIVLNMLQVEYLSSAGIRVMLKTFKDAKKAGGRFGIEEPSESVKNALGMTALDAMLID
jgi:anti-anti-sigma factor